jgi:hypothetical protein
MWKHCDSAFLELQLGGKLVLIQGGMSTILLRLHLMSPPLTMKLHKKMGLGVALV